MVVYFGAPLVAPRTSKRQDVSSVVRFSLWIWELKEVWSNVPLRISLVFTTKLPLTFSKGEHRIVNYSPLFGNSDIYMTRVRELNRPECAYQHPSEI